MGDCSLRVSFGVFRNLAVPILFGTIVVDRFGKGIFTAEGKVFPYNSKLVPSSKLTMETISTYQKSNQRKESMMFVKSYNEK